MMSKFTRSWALKGTDHAAPDVEPQPTKTTPAAPTGSPNGYGGGGGLTPSAYRQTYGQQQNGAGGQQPLKPSTAPTASLMASHGVDTTFSNQIYRAEEQFLTNTAPKAGATANSSSYGGDRTYPSATSGPYDNHQFRTKHNDHPTPDVVPQPTKTTPAAPTGSPYGYGGGGGLPPSAYRQTYGQQQNGAEGQQPTKPSTAPTASLTASHGVDTTFNNQIYRAEEQFLTNTAPKPGATANSSSYGGDGSYPSATPGPYGNQQFRTKHNTESAERLERANSRGYPPYQKEEKRLEMKSEHQRSAGKDNKSEVKDRDTNQMIRSPSMSTQSQQGKVLPRSKMEERTSAPADRPASWPPQYSTPQSGLDGRVVAYIVVPWGPNPVYNQNKESQTQDARMQRKESKTRDKKTHGGATAGMQRAASKPRDEMKQTNMPTNGTDSQQQASGFDRQELNDPYDGMGARQVGNPTSSTFVPALNEPSWVSMPSQKQNSRRLGAQESNEPHTYNSRQTSSKDRAAGATQMDQVAPGSTPLTASSQEIQDRKSTTRSPPKTNIQQAPQPVQEEKKGGNKFNFIPKSRQQSSSD
ncbi:hypothetical protein AKJ16_DCAP02819 [Drosera capensis]